MSTNEPFNNDIRVIRASTQVRTFVLLIVHMPQYLCPAHPSWIPFFSSTISNAFQTILNHCPIWIYYVRHIFLLKLNIYSCPPAIQVRHPMRWIQMRSLSMARPVNLPSKFKSLCWSTQTFQINQVRCIFIHPRTKAPLSIQSKACQQLFQTCIHLRWQCIRPRCSIPDQHSISILRQLPIFSPSHRHRCSLIRNWTNVRISIQLKRQANTVRQPIHCPRHRRISCPVHCNSSTVSNGEMLKRIVLISMT